MTLNDQQKLAVEHKAGPLLIIAGAGTGKTAVITQRIVHLINSKLAKPTEILALTFTEKAASEMEERVDMVMPYGYEEPWISTFHSFCDRILRQDGVHIGLDSNYQLMSQAQSYIFFRKHLFEMPLEKLRPLGNPTKFISDILKHFSRLQDEDVAPRDYVKFAKTLPKRTPEEIEIADETTELAGAYEVYTNLKIEHSKLDFGDLIIAALKLLREKPHILAKYQEQFKYILVDEYQDTNFTQNVLVNTLALGKDLQKATKKQRQQANVTVVGDDDQSIYKFRGAAISNIMQFVETYPDCERVVLTANYRSRQEILDAAYTLIQHNNPFRLEEKEKIDKRLKAFANFQKPKEDPVKLILAKSSSDEAELVAKKIIVLTGTGNEAEEKVQESVSEFDSRGQASFIDETKQNYKFSDIAILVRANDHADEFIQTLRYYGIPYKFFGRKSLYMRPEVKSLISFLKILKDYQDDINAYNLLQMSLWDFSSRDLIEIMRFAREMKISVFEYLEQVFGTRMGEDDELPAEYSLAQEHSAVFSKAFSEARIEKFYSIFKLIDSGWKELKKGTSVGGLLYNFVNDSGLINFYTKEDSLENRFYVQNISKYFDLIKDYEKSNSDSNLFEYIDYLDYSISVGETPSIDDDALADFDAVNISTVHSAKGLEFPVVFMVNLVSQRFPAMNRSDVLPIPENLIKEVLEGSEKNTTNIEEERRLFYVGATRAKEQLYLTAAQFYGDGKRAKKPSPFIEELLDRKIVPDEFSNLSGSERNELMHVYLSPKTDLISFQELGLRVPDQVSYSQINMYENCPKQYFYNYVLRLPTPKTAALSFGISIHNTLRDFYSAHKSFTDGLEGIAEKPTERELLKMFDSNWISQGYENKDHEEKRRVSGVELLKNFYKKIYTGDEKIVALERRFKSPIGDILVQGAIDRIDWDKEGESVRLYDYKTGRAKDSKQLNDDIQLALYAEIAETVLGYNVSGAYYVYVESGDIVEVSTSKKSRELSKSKIKSAVKLIRDGDFRAKPSFLCQYCDFRFICEEAQTS